MSKVDAEILERSIKNILGYAAGEEIEVDGETVKGKVRKFQETVELQIGLKNYDPSKDKRFSGTFKLPVVPRPNMKICLIGSEQDIERAGDVVECKSVEELKKLNKNKK